MHMLNPYCGVDRDPRGVVRLTICNAGSLNILGSAAITGVREGLEALAAEPQTRVLVIAGQSEKSMIGGADIKEMAKLDQASAETFITGLRDLCEAVRAFPQPVIARMPGWCSNSPPPATSGSRRTMPDSACPRSGSAFPASSMRRCCRG